MSYKVKLLNVFERQAKKLIKKYPSLKNEIKDLSKTLKEDPVQGKPLGKNCYKIRLAIKSKGRGKSGGARLITNIIIDTETVYLLSIYDKADKESLSDKELEKLLQEIPE